MRLLLLVLGDDVRQSPTAGGVFPAQPQLSRCCSSLPWHGSMSGESPFSDKHKNFLSVKTLHATEVLTIMKL